MENKGFYGIEVAPDGEINIIRHTVSYMTTGQTEAGMPVWPATDSWFRFWLNVRAARKFARKLNASDQA